MEGLLWTRVVQACVVVPATAACTLVPVLAYFGCPDAHFLTAATGTALLAPAELLTVAAFLQRSGASWPTKLFQGRLWSDLGCRLGLACAAATTTAFAAALIVMGFAGGHELVSVGGIGFGDLLTEATSTWDLMCFGVLMGVAMLWHLNAASVLTWHAMPLEATHRRLKSACFRLILTSVASTMICVCISLVLTSPGWRQIYAELLAAFVVSLVAQVSVEALRGSTSFTRAMREMHAGTALSMDLVEALDQPLSTLAKGTLGRWVATALLAQAVAHYQQDSNPNQAAPVTGAGLVVPTSAAPPLALEMFNCGASIGPRNMMGGEAWRNGAAVPGGDPLSPGLRWRTPGQVPPLLSPPMTTRSTGLFSKMLQSGLEVLREFASRLQCVEATSRRDTCAVLGPVRLAALDSSLAELEPLVRLAAISLSGWVCAGKDLDDTGLAQREDALRKVMHELCGVLDALLRMRPSLAHGGVTVMSWLALCRVEDVVKVSIQQLLLTFEEEGLREVALPPEYKRLLRTTFFCT
mmetsp:Transcript_24721/g.45305  ORF Transcript_24721/g.45305 Transcript_24721/m.45305 type:complete len:524 (+) Transcript_24721:55-1626(+)